MKILSRICILIISIIFISKNTIASPALGKVEQFFSGNGEQTVLLNAGASLGIKKGDLLISYRKTNDNKKIFEVETGLLKALKVYDTHTIAAVLKDNTDLSKIVFSRFPNLMAGDFVKEKLFNIARVQKIMPLVSFQYNELFKDPKRGPISFELSSEGIKKLTETGSIFSNLKNSKLIIKGFTDQKGPSDQNQIESYQRALTIKQFLVAQLHFDKNRIITIGLGEKEPKVDNYVPGYENINRRIEIKSINEE